MWCERLEGVITQASPNAALVDFQRGLFRRGLTSNRRERWVRLEQKASRTLDCEDKRESGHAETVV